MDTEHIVMTASEKMPLKCKGRYRKVAVVEVEKGAKPKMISDRARGVVRVVKIWRRLHVGKTDRSVYQIALSKANELVAKLNAQSENV